MSKYGPCRQCGWSGKTAPSDSHGHPYCPKCYAIALRHDGTHVYPAERGPAPVASIDPDTLDPGIRRLVTWLRSKGYETTDSGDGKTKPTGGDECAETIPHVYMRVRFAHDLASAANGLWSDLGAIGVKVVSFGHPGGAWIQATYDPAGNDDTACILSLHNVDDSALPEGV